MEKISHPSAKMCRGNYVHFYNGYQIARAWRTKAFYYGGVRLPAHITNYDMALKFVDKYLLPKMAKLGLYDEEKGWNAWTGECRCHFPFEHREEMEKVIEDNWFYYKKEKDESR